MPHIAIYGSSGYAGEELVRLLDQHPHIQEPHLCSNDEDPHTLQSDLVFLATDTPVSLELVPPLFARGIRVIDLSGAFRLRDPRLYKLYYGFRAPHPHQELLNQAVYGIPELNRGMIKDAALVANPGCYATLITLSLLPIKHLLGQDLIVRADAVSGYTGAGKHALIPLVVTQYEPGRLHRHVPEIEQTLNVTGFLHFYPRVATFPRGITAKLTLPDDVNVSRGAFATFYKSEPFVRIIPRASQVTKNIRNYCNISIHGNLIFSALDNLTKGAASQAIQNMNLMLGFPETEGLL